MPPATQTCYAFGLWRAKSKRPRDELANGAIHQHRVAGPEGATLGMLERSVRIDAVPLRLVVAADEKLMLEPIERFNLFSSVGARHFRENII